MSQPIKLRKLIEGLKEASLVVPAPGHVHFNGGDRCGKLQACGEVRPQKR